MSGWSHVHKKYISDPYFKDDFPWVFFNAAIILVLAENLFLSNWSLLTQTRAASRAKIKRLLDGEGNQFPRGRSPRGNFFQHSTQIVRFYAIYRVPSKIFFFFSRPIIVCLHINLNPPSQQLSSNCK